MVSKERGPVHTTGVISVVSGAALDLAGFSYTSAHTQAISINGTGVLSGGAIMNSGGAATFIGPVTFATDASVVGGTGTIALTGTIPTGTIAITFGGAAGGSIGTVIAGARTLTKEGAGTWTLSGANTYTNGTNINAGILALGSAGAIGSSGIISFTGGTLQYSVANTTDYSNRFSTAVNQIYNIDTNGQNVTFSTALTSSGGNLTKIGTGILTLSAANTYTGNTTINNGTLLLSNASSNNISASPIITIASGAVLNTTGLSGTADLVLASGQKLTGAGTVTGGLTIGSGSIIAPGVNTGTISNTGNVVYPSLGTYVWEINNATGTAGSSSGWDYENITGSLSITANSGSKFNINITSLNSSNTLGDSINFDKYSDYIWTIATASGGISGFATSSFNLSTTSLSNDISGTAANGYFTIQLSGNDLQLKYNAAVIGYLTVDIVDALGASVATSTINFDSLIFSFNYQTTTGIFGTTSEKIRVDNPTPNPQWSLSIAATAGPTSYWQGVLGNYDFNDPTVSAVDGADADSFGGQMTINPSTGTITPKGGCANTGLTLGSSNSFSQAVNDSVTLLTAGASTGVGCYWDLTGISVSQTIPAEQVADDYSLNMTISIIAI